MNKLFMLVALSGAVLTSTAAMADRDDDYDHKRWGYEHQMKYDHRYDNRDRYGYRYDDRDRYGHRYEDRRYKYKKAPPAHARAWGHESRRFQRGDVLPREYRSSRYYVEDWRSRDLYAPPYGYRWTEVDGKYLLVSTANNVISRIVYGR